jgi:undecaprenyl-diphosphatase
VGVIEAILYGIVQGLTEWLPISSTAHLRILPTVLGQPDPGAAFTAVIQLGTTLAVLLYFGKDLARAFGAWARSLAGGPKDTPEARIGWGVFWGSIPIVVLGIAFRKTISSPEFRSLYGIAAALIVMGILMWLAERFGPQRRTMDQITVRDGLWVGLFQALALLPGMSRSGSTITGGLFAGLDRPTAARYSFLLSVPSVLGAGFFELYNEREAILGTQLTPVLVATAVAFVVGYASIAFLLKWIQKHGIGLFVGYRIALGLALLVAVQQGVVPAVDPGATAKVQRDVSP